MLRRRTCGCIVSGLEQKRKSDTCRRLYLHRSGKPLAAIRKTLTTDPECYRGIPRVPHREPPPNKRVKSKSRECTVRALGASGRCGYYQRLCATIATRVHSDVRMAVRRMAVRARPRVTDIRARRGSLSSASNRCGSLSRLRPPRCACFT